MTVSIKIAGASFTKYVATMLQTIRFLTQSGAVESFTDGGFRYTFNPPNTNQYLNNATSALPSSADGYLSCVMNISFEGAVNTNPLLVASPNKAATTYGAGSFGIYVGAGGVIRITDGGVGNIPCNVQPNFTFASGAILRLRRAGISWFGEVSVDGGYSYSVVHNFVGASAAAMWPVFQVVGGTANEPLNLGFFGSTNVVNA